MRRGVSVTSAGAGIVVMTGDVWSWRVARQSSEGGAGHDQWLSVGAGGVTLSPGKRGDGDSLTCGHHGEV